MTTYDKDLLADKLARRAYKQEAPDPIKDAMVIEDKVKKSSCFGAVVAPVLVIAAAVALAFGASNINERAHALKQAKKYKAEYEQTGSQAAFDAYIYWEREVSRLLRQAQEAAYQKQVQS